MLDHLILPLFDLADVPASLRDYIYPEEQEVGKLQVTRTAYMVVLALRFILHDYLFTLEVDQDIEMYRVYWHTKDQYGFHTTIHLFRQRVEDYDCEKGDWYVAQEQLWIQLAELVCSNGRGIITEVITPKPRPYNHGQDWIRMNALTGVRHLLEDAAHAAPATHYYALRNDGDTTTVNKGEVRLSYTLKTDSPITAYVTDITLEVNEPYRW